MRRRSSWVGGVRKEERKKQRHRCEALVIPCVYIYIYIYLPKAMTFVGGSILKYYRISFLIYRDTRMYFLVLHMYRIVISAFTSPQLYHIIFTYFFFNSVAMYAPTA